MINILLGIAGITGVGKSFYKDKLVEKLGFEKIKILTTREPRIGEKNNSDKIFVSKEELETIDKAGEIAYKFDLLGVTYAYTKEALYSNKNTVFEMHYWCIKDFKRICPNIKTIYLFPKDINIAKENLKNRQLKPDVEINRLKEIDEHLEKIHSDKKLFNSFDYVLYNEYTKESEEELIDLVKMLIEKE